MWTAVTCNSLMVGTGMGLGTLSSQAFGAKNYPGLLTQGEFLGGEELPPWPVGFSRTSRCICMGWIGSYLLSSAPWLTGSYHPRNYRRVSLLWQRQCIYQWLLCVVIALVWYYTEPILLAFGQPPRVAANAAIWCHWQIHGLPALPMLNSINVFLQSQRVVRPSAVVALISNFGVTLPAAYFLTRPTSLGFSGAPFALGLGQLVQAAALCVVAPRVITVKACWAPCWRSRDAWRGWMELIRLGMGGAVGLWAEWWAAELMVFFAGILCTMREPGEACSEVAAGLGRIVALYHRSSASHQIH